MFHNIWFREINLTGTQSENAGGKEILWLQKQISSFPKAGCTYARGGDKQQLFLVFQNMNKITNIETFHNMQSSNSNKDCIWTADYLTYESWCIQGSP